MKNKLKLLVAIVFAVILVATVTAVGVIASEPEPALTVRAANVSFEGTVHLYFAVEDENVDSPEEIKLLVWKEGEISHVSECTLENASTVLTSGRTVDIDGTVCRVYDYEELAAAEMTTNVYARAYTVENGKTVYSPVVKYSILQYSLNKLGITGLGTDNNALKVMLREMLEYGAAAQQYFFPESDAPLATDSFVKIKAEGGTFKDGTTASLVKVGERVTIYSYPTQMLPHVMWYNASGSQVSADTDLTVTAKANATYRAQLSSTPSSFGRYDHVVIIGVDGAGAFNAPTPYIDSIFADGSVTRFMRVTSPTSSAASWASMLHGALPMHTGVYENALVEAVDATYPIDSLFPSFFKEIVTVNPDAKVAVYSGWSGITNGIMEDENLVNIPQTRDSDNNNVAAVKAYIEANKDFTALFLQLNNPDAAGHNNGYVSDAYTAAITAADKQIGEIYAALESAGILDRTLFIVTADHGGVNRTDGSGTGTHGGLSDDEKYCMFAVAGHTVEKDGAGAVDMQIRDVAAIALYSLGYTQPASYTARVPSGVFEGVVAGERPVFNDPTNYRDPVSKPTPEYLSSDFITNKIDNSLMVYLPFDGSTQELASGNKVSEVGTVTYENGYFGDAVVLDDGHLVMDNFAPGTESFTVSMWVKSPAPNGVPPIIASRDRAVGGSSKGFLLAMRRTTSQGSAAFTLEWSYGTGSAAPDSYNNPYYLPDDFSRGWFHVTCIVNRENGTIALSTDFGEFKIYNSSTYLLDDLDLTNELKKLVFGDDLSENYSSKMGLSIDEFMIFNGALTRGEVNKLAEYYGKEGVPTVGDLIGKEPTLQLDFDNAVANRADGSPVTVVGTPTYGSGISSQALLFKSDKVAVKAPEVKLGTGDFSAAFWIDINSLSGSTIPIFSTQHGEGGVSIAGTQGITFAVGTKAATGEKYFEFYFANGSKDAKIVTALPEDVADLGWMHVAVVVNRATSVYTLYIDFKMVTSEVLKYGTTVVPATWTADGGKEDSVFTIGESGSGDYWNDLDAYIDDFMLFDSVLDKRTVNALAKQYGREGDPIISDFVGTDPTVELDFDGNVTNKGMGGAEFDDVSMNYVDSPFGMAGNFTSVDHSKSTPEYWANSSGLELSKKNGDGILNDITISLWLSMQTDMVIDGCKEQQDYINAGAAQWYYGDRVLFATHDYSYWKTAGKGTDGMNVFLYSKPTKILLTDLLKVSYMNAEDYTSDESGYAVYASGEHEGEYVYRQRLTIRFRATHDGVMMCQQNAYYIYAPLGGWTNVVMVIERGDFGKNNANLAVYQDGNKVAVENAEIYKDGTSIGTVTDKNAIHSIIADYGTLSGEGFFINDDVGHYPRDMESYLDEFTVFDKALTEDELAGLAAYYDAIRDK